MAIRYTSTSSILSYSDGWLASHTFHSAHPLGETEEAEALQEGKKRGARIFLSSARNRAAGCQRRAPWRISCLACMQVSSMQPLLLTSDACYDPSEKSKALSLAHSNTYTSASTGFRKLHRR